jgi:hypothetical protein
MPLDTPLDGVEHLVIKHRLYGSNGIRVDKTQCVVNSRCLGSVVAGSPVALCAKHFREVYQFAQDIIAEGWDSAVRDYVSDLHKTFKPPRSVTKQPRQGYVYFIQLGDRVKIGFTENPKQRFRDLPHEKIIGIVKGTRADEKGWHVMLADYRVVGEWFVADPELLEVLHRVSAVV